MDISALSRRFNLIEGQKVERVHWCPSNLHDIYLKLELKTLDAEEHHTGTEAVQSETNLQKLYLIHL